MPVDSELTLGVLFAGRVDESFRRETQRLRDILFGLSKTMTTASAAVVTSGKKAKKAGDEFSDFGKKISRVEGGFQRLTNAMKVTASYGLAGTFLFGVIRTLKQGVVEIANFDQSLKNLQAITGATNPEIAALRDVILDVAQHTRYSAGEISEAAITLGQAGFTAAENLSVLRSVADLATGTLSNMKETSDLLTSALRAFGEGANQSARYSDVFASAINKSKLDVQKLRIAFNYLGPIANQVGLNLEETAAGAMVLGNAGLRGSTIGTGFRRVLQLLVAPTDKLKVLFHSVGADLDKLNPSLASMADVVGELEKLLGATVEPTERARRAFELFGLRGATAAAALAQSGKAGFEAMLKEVYRVGVAAEMAEKQMEGLSTMAKNLMDRLVNLAIAIGEGGLADAFRLILPFLRTFVSLLTEIINTVGGRALVAFVALTSTLAILRITMKYLIVQATALAASMTVAQVQAYTAAHGLLTTAIYGTFSAMSKLFTLLKTHPWFLVATGISAAAVALYTYLRYQRETIPNLEKEGVHIDQNIVKLEDYRERLSKVKEGTMEYRSTLERLIQEYPELAHNVDILNGRFLDQGKALEELILNYRTLRLENLATKFSEYLEKIGEIEKSIKNYETLIERNANNSAFVKRQTATMNELKRQLRELKIHHEASFKSIAQLLLDLGLTTRSSFDMIQKKIMETFHIGAKEAESLSIYVASYYDRIRLLEGKATEGGMTLLQTQEGLLNSLGEKWLSLYRKLDDLRKADLIKTVFDMRDKIEKMEEEAEKMGWTEEQLQAKINQLSEETYRNFMEKETAKEKKARKVSAQIAEAYLKSTQQMEDAEKAEARARAENRTQQVKDSISDANERRKQITLIEKTLANELTDIEEKYSRKRQDLISEISEYKLKATSKTVEAEIAAAKQAAEAFKRRVEDEVRSEELKRELLANIETALQQDIDRIRQKYDDKASGSRKEKILNLEEEVRLGLMTVEQYYAELDRLAEQHLISERQRAEQRARIQANVWDAMRSGFTRSQAQITTWSETLYDVGGKAADTISSDLTTGILDFADATASAGDAFENFAKRTLRWIGEMIIKQQLLNSLFGPGGPLNFGAKAAPAASVLNNPNYAVNMPVAHSGGKIGGKSFPRIWVDPSIFNLAPRLHSGLKRNEYPAILEKGEEVLSKKEVVNKDNSDGVQIIIQNAPAGTTVKQQKSPGNPRKVIIDVAVEDIATGGPLSKMLQAAYGVSRTTSRR